MRGEGEEQEKVTDKEKKAVEEESREIKRRREVEMKRSL